MTARPPNSLEGSLVPSVYLTPASPTVTPELAMSVPYVEDHPRAPHFILSCTNAQTLMRLDLVKEYLQAEVAGMACAFSPSRGLSSLLVHLKSGLLCGRGVSSPDSSS
ncbi:hypothetical protein MVEN_01461700 [Mycena venus]|uniref:Uncharacterized protein n=1 Tax=Mycena venus TaxID=2733690 RepID=A0A8H6XVE7_9AGAR|nr:hypothetical protein MVEN_01461700 [Mycena venus]